MDKYSFDDSLRPVDWSTDLPDVRGQVPTTDSLAPPPPKDNGTDAND